MPVAFELGSQVTQTSVLLGYKVRSSQNPPPSRLNNLLQQFTELIKTLYLLYHLIIKNINEQADDEDLG